MIWNREFSEGDGGKISVVIPVLNESSTITSVVLYALSSPLVDEVIVVDDGSIDGSPELATLAGARVVTSTMLGKGMSMEDGTREARNEIVLFLDGDITGLHEHAIELMVAPLLNNEADFVKARFTRAAGRVTVLTAKPLLRTYFPELSHFAQPLSGIMAARKSLLQELTFENDYGVDIGLLIDASLAHARVCEVDIGSLEHRSQSLQALGEMATQVARALLERAARANRLRLSYIRESKENERMEKLSLEGFLDRVPATTDKIALFDMDGVLLNGRFVVSLAQEADKETDLAALLDNYAMPANQRMQQIAAVFAGVRKETFEKVAREIPLMPGAQETVVALKKAGYRVGIVTDSYNVSAEIVRRRVFADFAFSHFMRFKNGKASGRFHICPAMIHPDGCLKHDHCKVNVIHHLVQHCDLTADQILAVGDGENDICMLKAAGCSVAFLPKTKRVRGAAKFKATLLQEIPFFAGATLLRKTNRESTSDASDSSDDLRDAVSN
ncbi:MAG TPA: HAD-IB family phosphatase [Candidatus Kapabacteria bacterium]|nr:HAD-IB family phosphatase [Candidatus Kapabacteria bacterium]